MQDYEEIYDSLKEEHGLPELDDVCREFDISVTDDHNIVNEIIRGITDFLFETAKILEGVIFIGDHGGVSYLYEATMVKNRKDKLFKVFRNIMAAYWKGKGVNVGGNVEECAHYIKDIFYEWQKKIKPEIVKLYSTFEKGWKNTRYKNSDITPMYLG